MEENDIFKQISHDLGIRKGDGESLEHWQCRLAYSAAAWRGLACLWEYEEGTDGKSVSMQHVLGTIEDTLSTFGKLFPSIQAALKIFEEKREEKLSEHIRRVLQNGACFYHKANRAAPSAPACASEERISFLRGLSPGDFCCMSGAGAYRKEGVRANQDPNSMFGLLPLLSEKDLERFESTLSGERRTSLENREFLQLDASRLKNGYWKDRPDKGVLSLLRRKDGERSYALYRFDGETFSCRFLPGYWNEGMRYAILASSLLARQTLPPFKVVKTGSLVSVTPGYLLPPSEDAFFRLYSWPDLRPDMIEKDLFSPRIMEGEIYSAFQAIMTRLGYRFMETENV